MKTYIYTLIAASALALASCAKDTSIKPEQAGQMRFAVSVEGTTKASMTSTDLQQLYLKVDGPGSAFSYFESITKDQNGNWVASKPLLWKNEDAVITYSAASYGALGKEYFNAQVTNELFTSGAYMGILPDQSTQANLNAADLLTMKATELAFANSNGGVVPITFSHGLAKVNFEFTLADEFFDNGIGLEASPVKDVVINGVAAGFNFKPLTGEVTAPGYVARAAVVPFAGQYVPGTETAKAAVATFESILAPETIAAGALKLYFTVGAKDYEWTNSEALVLAQGGEYTVPVSVAYSTAVGPEPEPEPAFVALPFSVGATKQVLFSQGNLMFSNGAFGFHTHQYDACVTTTGSSDISSNYTAEGTFDLFGWGTSGNAHRTGYYQPWSIGGTYPNYYAYGNSNKNLYDDDGSADWGANAIGTDPAGTWRTLTRDEWTYLFANHTHGYSDVAGVKGYVIRPDGDETAVAATYTAVEWNAQEAAGAVFLPIVGRRGTAATNFGNYGTQGTYWSSTDYGNGTYAYNVLMTASSVDCSDYSTKGQGLNVRLVKDITAPAPAGVPFTIEALSAGTIVVNNPKEGMQYSKNGGAKAAVSGNIDVAAGDKVFFYGNGTEIASYQGTTITGIGDGFTCNAYGNIMSLLDEKGYATATTLSGSGVFSSLFGNNTALIDASGLLLPATTLVPGCYYNMFSGCSALTAAPELPATTLAEQCYTQMFQGCSALEEAPELPATTLASNCYRWMFYNCTALTTAPELPATTLAVFCYANMFYNCTSLATAPELPATTLATGCYTYMFQNCSNLSSVTCLATDISANSCTDSWLYGAGSNVTDTKTFTAASDATWPSGVNGIPTGWTRLNPDGSEWVNTLVNLATLTDNYTAIDGQTLTGTLGG